MAATGTDTRSAVVVYGSRFGNTRRVAEALARGISQVHGVQVLCVGIEDVPRGTVENCDLLAIGGPTEMFTASKPMKAFLEGVTTARLEGKRAFVFETKLNGRLYGSAAKYIGRRLEQFGMHIVRPPVTAFVRPMNKEEQAKYGEMGAPDWARRLGTTGGAETAPSAARVDLLIPGWETEFERVGRELGSLLSPIPA